jgi:hypothetical protein
VGGNDLYSPFNITRTTVLQDILQEKWQGWSFKYYYHHHLGIVCTVHFVSLLYLSNKCAIYLLKCNVGVL